MKKQQIIALAVVLIGGAAIAATASSQVKAGDIEKTVKEKSVEVAEQAHDSKQMIASWIAQEGQKNRDLDIKIENQEQIRDVLSESQLNVLAAQINRLFEENNINTRFVSIPRENIVVNENGNLDFVCGYSNEGEAKAPGIRGSYEKSSNTYHMELL